MKKVISILLVLVLALGILSGTVCAAELPFADVPVSAWYYSDVKNAYEMELINGKSGNLFAPNDYLTYAEAVKLAACMHQRYETGTVSLTNGKPWYQSYVDYCKDNGIIQKEYTWNANATRAGHMEIFAYALPDEALAQINEVENGSIPDVPMSHPQAAAIYKLYRAGILQGNDAAHNCNPAANIKRSEVAAVLTRMMDSTERIRFSMGKKDAETETETEEDEDETKPLKIKEQPVDASGKSGDEVILEVWIEGGKSPYTYTWLCGDERSAGVLNGRDDVWVSGGSRSASGSFFSKLHITLPADDSVIGDTIFCVIEDADGQKVTSDMVTVTMEEEQKQPLKVKTSGAVTVEPGETAEVSVSVSGGSTPYKYCWQQYFTDGASRGMWRDAGADTATMAVRVPPAHSGGTYTFRCIVTDATGYSITGDIVRVTVEAPQPLELTYETDAAGDTVTLMVYAEGGTEPYTFTWQGYANMAPTTAVKDWKGITIASGKTSSSLTVNMTKCSCTKYICTVRDADGTSRSVEITIK